MSLKHEEQMAIRYQQGEEQQNSNLTVATATKRKIDKEKFIDETIKMLKNQLQLDVVNKDENLTDFENREIKALAKVKGSAIEIIRNSIYNYNDKQRRGDVFFKDKNVSTYPCNSVTCKERGKKIQKALRELLMFSPEALGKIGYYTSTYTVNKISNSFSSLFKSKSKPDLSEFLQNSFKVINIAKQLDCPKEKNLTFLRTLVNASNDRNKQLWLTDVDNAIEFYKKTPLKSISDIIVSSITNDTSCVFSSVHDITLLLKILPYVKSMDMSINDPSILANIDKIPDTTIDLYEKKHCLKNIINTYKAWCVNEDKTKWLSIRKILELLSKKTENPDIDLSTQPNTVADNTANIVKVTYATNSRSALQSTPLQPTIQSSVHGQTNSPILVTGPNTTHQRSNTDGRYVGPQPYTQPEQRYSQTGQPNTSQYIDRRYFPPTQYTQPYSQTSQPWPFNTQRAGRNKIRKTRRF